MIKEYAKEELISEFLRWMENHEGKIPKTDDMKIKDGYPNETIYYRVLETKSWVDVLKIVGVKRSFKGIRHEYKYDKYTEQDFIDMVVNKYKELGRIPIKDDFINMNGLPTGGCIHSRLKCKSWDETLEKCGVSPTKEEIKQLILDACKVKGGAIGRDEIKKYNLPSKNTIFRKFNRKRWMDILSDCGLVSDRPIYDRLSDEDLLNYLREYYNKNKTSPKERDLREDGKPTSVVYYKRFKTMSWNKILELAGLPINHFQGWTNELVLKSLLDYFNIFKKIPTREEYEKNNWLPNWNIYNEKFGGFQYACYELGLCEKPLNIDERVKISISELISLAKRIERCPTVWEYESLMHRGLCRRDLEKKLGLKYNLICKKYFPEYKVNVDWEITNEQLIDILKIAHEDLGRPPMYIELKKYSRYSYGLYQRKFNMPYNKIIESLGWIPTGNSTMPKTEDEMLEDFNNLFIKLNRIPYAREIDGEPNMSSYPTYITRFGSIKCVCDLLEIDYNLYYKNTGAGTVCVDVSGGLCRSIPEMTISNFLIESGICFTKENHYSEIIDKDNRRFDWKIYNEDNTYTYVEYFGMYHTNPRGNIAKRYLKKTKKKIRDLYKVGIVNQCIFIFPNDLKNKTLDEIFHNVIVKNKKIA